MEWVQVTWLHIRMADVRRCCFLVMAQQAPWLATCSFKTMLNFLSAALRVSSPFIYRRTCGSQFKAKNCPLSFSLLARIKRLDVSSLIILTEANHERITLIRSLQFADHFTSAFNSLLCCSLPRATSSPQSAPWIFASWC